MYRFTLRRLSDQIQGCVTTAEAVVSNALKLAHQSESVFVCINDQLLDQAINIDRMLRTGKQVPRLSGIPVSLKDLFDVQGEVTLAGSVALEHSARPAVSDCEVLKPLRSAGLFFLGRTNMSEFAFSGTGMNPHYGNPKSIWDRQTGRLAGGSSSGSAVSVAEGIVPVAMGSDTAGSCRIPAAFNGIVGVKPSYGRFSLQGVYPLSHSSDAPGPLGVDLDSCFILDQLLDGRWDAKTAIPELDAADILSLKFLVPDNIVLDDLDREIEDGFERAILGLTDAGATIIRKPLPVIDECIDLFMTRAIAGFEAYQLHKQLLEDHGDEYDTYVYTRLMSYKSVTQEEQELRYTLKSGLRGSFSEVMRKKNYDAVVYPTTPCVPPRICDAEITGDAGRINLRCLRNTATVNNFDGCSISLPCHDAGQAPVGLMISSVHGDDQPLYQICAAVEQVLNTIRAA